MYKVNNNGPKQDPSGSPHERSAAWEETPSIRTRCFLSFRSDENHSMEGGQ